MSVRILSCICCLHCIASEPKPLAAAELDIVEYVTPMSAGEDSLLDDAGMASVIPKAECGRMEDPLDKRGGLPREELRLL
jgi:hypothetical protein